MNKGQWFSIQKSPIFTSVLILAFGQDSTKPMLDATRKVPVYFVVNIKDYKSKQTQKYLSYTHIHKTFLQLLTRKLSSLLIRVSVLKQPCYNETTSADVFRSSESNCTFLTCAHVT